LRQVPIQAAIDQTEQADDDQGQQDEIDRQDGIGDERVEGLVGKEIGIVERVARFLLGRQA
jgi:hypothetical protein